MMLKDYVTQKLPFLQIPGKRGKTPKNPDTPPEETADSETGAEPAEAVSQPLETEGEQEPPQETAESNPAAASEDIPDTEEITEASSETDSVVPEDENREQSETEILPGQADFEAGMRACQEKKYPEALETLLRAAGTGHKEAQFLCGQLYQRGLAADADEKRALTWYKRSAKQGLLPAQLACAAMYEEGTGTAMNMKRALYWYEQAARQGSVTAQLKCGRMYYCGRAETRNPKKARVWLETAAEHGSEDAQKLLSEYF